MMPIKSTKAFRHMPKLTPRKRMQNLIYLVHCDYNAKYRSINNSKSTRFHSIETRKNRDSIFVLYSIEYDKIESIRGLNVTITTTAKTDNEAYHLLKKAYSIDFNNVKNKYMLFILKTNYGKYILDELSISCFWTNRLHEGKKYLLQIVNDKDFKQYFCMICRTDYKNFSILKYPLINFNSHSIYIFEWTNIQQKT